MEMCSLDFITGLTPSKQGHDAILVCVDKLSKMAHFIATMIIVTMRKHQDYIWTLCISIMVFLEN